MAIDPNIALGVKPIQLESPLNQLGQVLQLQSAQQANQLNRLKLDEYDRGVARQNQLRTLLGGLGDVPDEKRVSALRTGGYFDEADKLETGLLARQKTGAEVTKLGAEAKAKEFEGLTKKLEVAGSTFGFVMKNPTLDNAMQALDYLGTNGIYTPEQVNQYKAQIQQNPASIGQLAETAFRSVLSAKDQLGKADTVNAGNRQVTQVVDPVTGKIQVSGEMQILESEAQRLKREQDAAEAARSRAVTMRGQDMTDARVRESNEIARTSQASKTPAEKPLTEGQSKALLFGARMQAAEDVLTKLAESGTEVSIPGSRSGYGVGSVVNALQPQQRQQLDQAKRDFINAVLRRESGAVISPEEFDNAERQYFPQPGEGPQQRAQKKANRELATRGILAEVPDAARRVEDIRAKPAKPQMNPQDAQALEWANANPKDPRAAQIKQRLGQ